MTSRSACHRFYYITSLSGCQDAGGNKNKKGNLLRIKNRSNQTSESTTPIVAHYGETASDISILQLNQNVKTEKVTCRSQRSLLPKMARYSATWPLLQRYNTTSCRGCQVVIKRRAANQSSTDLSRPVGCAIKNSPSLSLLYHIPPRLSRRRRKSNKKGNLLRIKNRSHLIQ